MDKKKVSLEFISTSVGKVLHGRLFRNIYFIRPSELDTYQNLPKLTIVETLSDQNHILMIDSNIIACRIFSLNIDEYLIHQQDQYYHN